MPWTTKIENNLVKKEQNLFGQAVFGVVRKQKTGFYSFFNCNFFLSLDLFLVFLRLLAENKLCFLKIPFSGSIEAHKFCLSALSPVFKQMFSGPLSQQVKSNNRPVFPKYRISICEHRTVNSFTVTVFIGNWYS